MGTGGEKRKELGAKEGGRAEQGSPGGAGAGSGGSLGGGERQPGCWGCH